MAGTTGRVLLLVEDEPIVMRALVAATRRSFKVLRARTRAEAMRVLDELDGVDLAGALIDLRLPDGTGLDGLIRLRERCPQAIAVVLTGTDPDPAMIERHGASLEHKPVDPDKLRRILG